jgi:hypothetical protein
MNNVLNYLNQQFTKTTTTYTTNKLQLLNQQLLINYFKHK